jgi:hypothetical protein
MAAPRPQQLLLLLLVSLLAASAPRRADAWGKEGHIMTCKIAEVRCCLLPPAQFSWIELDGSSLRLLGRTNVRAGC